MINIVIIASADDINLDALVEQSDIHATRVKFTQLEQTVERVSHYVPDVIIIEQHIDMVDVDILSHSLALRCPNARNLVLIEHSPTLEMLQNSGFTVRGYITPNQRPMLAKAIRVVHKGEAWLSRKLVGEILDNFSSIDLERLAS